MTSPYISATANVANDSNRRSLSPFAYTTVVLFYFSKYVNNNSNSTTIYKAP